MKKAFVSLLLGFGAVLGVLVAVAMPPGSWAVIVGGVVVGGPLIFVIWILYKITMRQVDNQVHERNETASDRFLERGAIYADRQHERQVTAQSYQVIVKSIGQGARVYQSKNGQDMLKLTDGKVVPANQRLNEAEIEAMYQLQAGG